jgi:hypothetical protein
LGNKLNKNCNLFTSTEEILFQEMKRSQMETKPMKEDILLGKLIHLKVHTTPGQRTRRDLAQNQKEEEVMFL